MRAPRGPYRMPAFRDVLRCSVPTNHHMIGQLRKVRHHECCAIVTTNIATAAATAVAAAAVAVRFMLSPSFPLVCMSAKLAVLGKTGMAMALAVLRPRNAVERPPSKVCCRVCSLWRILFECFPQVVLCSLMTSHDGSSHRRRGSLKRRHPGHVCSENLLCVATAELSARRTSWKQRSKEGKATEAGW